MASWCGGILRRKRETGKGRKRGEACKEKTREEKEVR
jgi:hypothetical protein